MAVGIHRIKNGWGPEHSVLVRYEDGSALEIPQSQYLTSRYLPDFEKLPWRGRRLDA